jgi:hypothetical protein
MTRMFGCKPELEQDGYTIPSFTILQALYYFSALAEATVDVVETRPGPAASVSTAVLADPNAATVAPIVGYQNFQFLHYNPQQDYGQGPYDQGYQYNMEPIEKTTSIIFEPWEKKNQLGPKTWLAKFGRKEAQVVLKAWDAYKQEIGHRDNEVALYLRLRSLWGECIPALIASGPIDFLNCLVVEYIHVFT